MNSFPVGITNNFNNGSLNFSYVHSVLQSLCFLDSTNNFFSFMEKNGMRFNMLYPIANEFLNIIYNVKNGIISDSQNILYLYSQKYLNNQMNIQSRNVLANDPFHFFYFLLQFLHLETNVAQRYNNSLFNQSLMAMRNEDYMYMLFLQFIFETQNSIISNQLFNTVRYMFNCPNCGLYYSFGLQNIFRMKLDTIRYHRDKSMPMKIGNNLNLSELFIHYSGGNYSICKHCNYNKTKRYTRICFPAKTVIISLERKNHCFYKDVDFSFNFDIREYISKTKTKGININTNYELKAVISYTKFGNEGKYFADCKIKSGMNHIWIRYVDKYYFTIKPQNIFDNEPQILIYEVNDQFYQQQNMLINNNVSLNQMNVQMMNNNLNNMYNMDMSNNINNNMINQYVSNNNMNLGFNMNNNNMNNNNNDIIYINNNGPKELIPRREANVLYYNNNMNNMMNNNNNFMLQNNNILENMNSLSKMDNSFSPVQQSTFNQMTLVKTNYYNKETFEKSLIKVHKPSEVNNPFVQQINQFNNMNNNAPNMQINMNLAQSSKEISVGEAQNQNKNFMRYFECDYLSGDQ